MVAHDLGNKGKPQTPARALAGDEGLENVWLQFFGNATAGVVNANFQRQRHTFAAAADGKSNTGPESCRKQDFTALAGLIDGFRRILSEVQEHLHKLVHVAADFRQGRIIIFAELHCGVSRSHYLLHAVKYDVDVDGFSFNRPFVRKYFHLVNQQADAVGFIADQPRQ